LVALIQLFFYFKKKRNLILCILSYSAKAGLVGQLAAKIAGRADNLSTTIACVFIFKKKTPASQRTVFCAIIEEIAQSPQTSNFFVNKEI